MNNTEKLIETSIDLVYDDLAELVPYLTLPPEYTTGYFSPNGEGLDDDEHLHSPSPEFFDLIVWNIVIAFWVNVLASAAYERVFAKKTELKTKEELRDIQAKIVKESKTTVKLDKSSRAKIIENTTTRTVAILTMHSVPESEVNEKINNLLERLLKEVDEGDKSNGD